MFAALVINEENYEIYKRLAEKTDKIIIEPKHIVGNVVVKDTITGEWYWADRGEFDKNFRFVHENVDINRFNFVSRRRD